VRQASPAVSRGAEGIQQSNLEECRCSGTPRTPCASHGRRRRGPTGSGYDGDELLYMNGRSPPRRHRVQPSVDEEPIWTSSSGVVRRCGAPLAPSCPQDTASAGRRGLAAVFDRVPHLVTQLRVSSSTSCPGGCRRKPISLKDDAYRLSFTYELHHHARSPRWTWKRGLTERAQPPSS